jgi:selenocysteine lyase/cysteine desulfurase
MNLDDDASEFPDPHSVDYYNTAGLGLCPVSVRDEVKRYVDASCVEATSANQKHLHSVTDLRAQLSELLSCTAGEVALMHHTAEAANVIARGLQWQAGDAIMTLDREYPSTMYPWMNVQKLDQVRLILLQERDGRIEEDVIVDALDRDRPRLLAMSAVEWCTGYRFDLQEIGEACRRLGTFFFVDAAQSLGFWEIDVEACQISALAGSAWKWLFGPLGMGYLYLHRDLLERVTPPFVGSESVVNPREYLEYDFTFERDMRRFEYSTINLSAVVWFDAGIRFVRQHGLERIRAHVFALQDYAIQALRSIGCAVRGDLPTERRSGIMGFRHPRIPSRELATRLYREAGIIARERDGFVRLSFHLYNDRRGIDRLVNLLATMT